MLKQFIGKFHHDYAARINSVVITKELVRKHLLNLDPSKQGGEDGISNKPLKIVATSLDKPLSKLFNLCLLTGIFPNSWKLGIVVLIYKNKGSKSVQFLTSTSKVGQIKSLGITIM
jgi:hypothetical protein